MNQILNYRKNNIARNEFETAGKYDMPIIKNQNIDINKIQLIGFNNTKHNDLKNNNKTVHFFTYDFKFKYVYSRPELALKKLKQYYCVLSPDFSLYTDMPIPLQIKNTFKNRWCGAFLQQSGLNVIPTVEWSDERSFDFCFDGIEKNSIVAVSTYGKQKIKTDFLKGYNKMLEILNPCAIICYEKPFLEMNGPLKIFPFNHNEWRDIK